MYIYRYIRILAPVNYSNLQTLWTLSCDKYLSHWSGEKLFVLVFNILCWAHKYTCAHTKNLRLLEIFQTTKGAFTDTLCDSVCTLTLYYQFLYEAKTLRGVKSRGRTGQTRGNLRLKCCLKDDLCIYIRNLAPVDYSKLQTLWILSCDNYLSHWSGDKLFALVFKITRWAITYTCAYTKHLSSLELFQSTRGAFTDTLLTCTNNVQYAYMSFIFRRIRSTLPFNVKSDPDMLYTNYFNFYI